MKMIKRTTIKIRRRELVIVASREPNSAEKVHRCPNCNFPINGQRSLKAIEKTPLELPAINK